MVRVHIGGQRLIPGSFRSKICRMNSIRIIRLSGVLYIELRQSVTSDNIFVMIDIYIECGKLF